MKPIQLSLLEIRDEGPRYLHLRLGPPCAELETGLPGPGLCVTIGYGDLVEAVGAASRPATGTLEVLLSKTSDLGQALARAGTGAAVTVTDITGEPIPLFDRRGCDIYAIGHGAGMGPVRAIILEAIRERGAFGEVVAFCEDTYPTEIPYHEEMAAWQRAGVRVCQTLSRPDVGKWMNPGNRADAEGAYVYDFLGDQIVEPEDALVFVAGPHDVVAGVTAALRALDIAPDQVYVFPLPSARTARRPEPERSPEHLAKITPEARWGSGHQDDAPDHPPVLSTPTAQPSGGETPRYKRAVGH